MGNINDPSQQIKRELQNGIAALEEEIAQVEREYESLLRFRDSVSSAQNNFNEANDHRRAILKDLDPVKTNNTLVQKYQSGMGDQLTGIGMKVVDGAFVGLQFIIGLRLTEYWNRLTGLRIDKTKKEIEYNTLDCLM